MRLRSLRVRLIAVFAAVVVTAMGVLFLYVVPSLRANLIADRQARLASIARSQQASPRLKAALQHGAGGGPRLGGEAGPQVASHMRSLRQSKSQIKMLEVVTAGDHAVAAMGEYKPHVVIVDALLQGRVTGTQVAQSLRQADPQVAVIMLTVPQNPIREDPERGIDAVHHRSAGRFTLHRTIRRS